jgi:phosphate uptake regulator
MEYRKLIKFGNSSHVISIPKPWIKKHNIKKGNIIHFREDEKNNLILSPNNPEDEKRKGKTISINIDGLSKKETEIEIIENYIKEFDKIKITGKEITKRDKEIRDILNELVAIEVIEQTKDRIVAKDFLDIKSVHLRDMERRLDLVLKSMLIDSKFGTGKENHQNILNRDYDANKLTYVLLRVIRRCLENPGIAKTANLTPLELMHKHYIVLAMERIGDLSKRISKLDAKTKFSKEIVTELNKVHEMLKENYNRGINAYRHKNYEKIKETFLKNSEIQDICEKCCKKIDCTKEVYDAIHLLREMSSNISMVAEGGLMDMASTKASLTYEEPEGKSEEKPL